MEGAPWGRSMEGAPWASDTKGPVPQSQQSGLSLKFLPDWLTRAAGRQSVTFESRMRSSTQNLRRHCLEEGLLPHRVFANFFPCITFFTSFNPLIKGEKNLAYFFYISHMEVGLPGMVESASTH